VRDVLGSADTTDYLISFSVASGSSGGTSFQPVLLWAVLRPIWMRWGRRGSRTIGSGVRRIFADRRCRDCWTADPALYQTARVNPSAYELAVPNGTHTVKLKFAETVATGPGSGV